MPICLSTAGIFYPENVTLFNSYVNPQKLHIGDKFVVASTLVNGLNSPIKIMAGGCSNPMVVSFDKNVFTPPNPTLICFNPNLVKDILQPHERIQYVSPNYGKYITLSSGNTTANISTTKYKME